MKALFLIVFLFSFSASFSQAVISFSNSMHDFGNIKEVNGTVTYDFEFVNKGKSPILIKNVESSCGCTSPEWTKQPVLPGKKGYVKATFDPKDRPGFFDKTITVHSNAATPVVILKIKGTVEGKTRTVLDDYPYELSSGLRLPLEHISLMKVRKGEIKKMDIGVFNNAGKQVSVGFGALPAHIQMSIEPQTIPNKGKATIHAAYNTVKNGEYGLNKESVKMLVDGKEYLLPVSVFIEEDLSKVEPGLAPGIEADKKYYNFGQVSTSAPLSYTYHIRNTGRGVMKIHRVYTNDDRFSAEVSRKELQPGESAEVIVKKSQQQAEAGNVTCLVSVISNCPANPELSLRFFGDLK